MHSQKFITMLHSIAPKVDAFFTMLFLDLKELRIPVLSLTNNSRNFHRFFKQNFCCWLNDFVLFPGAPSVGHSGLKSTKANRAELFRSVTPYAHEQVRTSKQHVEPI